MKRHYIALYDDGHDFGTIEYDSEYRKNSNANFDDAYSELKKRYGRHRANAVKIINVTLYN